VRVRIASAEDLDTVLTVVQERAGCVTHASAQFAPTASPSGRYLHRVVSFDCANGAHVLVAMMGDYVLPPNATLLSRARSPLLYSPTRTSRAEGDSVRAWCDEDHKRLALGVNHSALGPLIGRGDTALVVVGPRQGVDAPGRVAERANHLALAKIVARASLPRP
jgi:hypothetical protein